MIINWYQKEAMKTNAGKTTDNLLTASIRYASSHHSPLKLSQLFNAILGLNVEVGEFSDALKKILFHEKEFDEKHLKEELGDILWYIALICDTFQWDLDTIMFDNIQKLNQCHTD